MAKKKGAKQKEPTFEERLDRLEKLVERLESGEAGLDESLKLYTEGAELVNACRRALGAAEKKIAKLARHATAGKHGGLAETAGGKLEEEPFEPEEV